MVQKDPIVYPTSLPALTWISGQDSLLVVSIVTTQKIPLLDFVCSFSFSCHCDIMHHHAYLTLHVFVKSKIIWLKIYFYYLARMVL
jgi:hypothetical protein